MTIQRCPVCNVAWYEGEAPKHVMDCHNRTFVPYPGPDCDHEWDFEKDRCIKCGATWQETFDR